MDYHAIIMTMLALFGTWEGINNVRYRRENRRLKQNEVKTSNVNTQVEEINLADMYKNKVIELLEQMNSKQDDGTAELAQRLTSIESMVNTKLTSMIRTQTSDNRRLGMVEKYLGDSFNEFSKTQKKKKP